MKIMLEFWGDNVSLAMGEIKGILEGEKEKYEVVEEDFPIVIVDLEDWRVLKRAGLLRRIARHIKSSEEIPEIDLELDNFAVRARRYFGLRKISTKKIEEEIGKRISGRVNLEKPENIVRVAVTKRIHVGIELYDFKNENFEERKARNYPISYPITMHPRFIRAMINLARVKKEDKIIDPFCGIGTILIEAGLMNLIPFGSDISDRMIKACKVNLKKFGIEAKLGRYDISEIRGKYDAVITDPPYGRSSSTGGENIKTLYRRAFKKFSDITDKVSIVLPNPESVEIGKEYFDYYEFHLQRVHKSLTRYFAFFSK